MKALVTILFSLLLFQNAEASYLSIKCSNSTGSVMWEEGHDDNTIHMKYANFVEGTLTLPLEQVNITFDKQVTIKEKKIRECSYMASHRVYAGNVKIVAAEAFPDVLKGQFPENMVETEVICSEYMNDSLPCNKPKFP